MLCQNCGKNEANIRYTQIINGSRKELALCDECAAKLGIEKMSLTMGFGNLFGDFFNDFAETAQLPELSISTAHCKKCGLTLEDFVHTGKFGCEECYDTPEQKEYKENKEEFKEETVDKKAKLEQEMKQAIAEERYEDAAKIRDQLKEVK